MVVLLLVGVKRGYYPGATISTDEASGWVYRWLAPYYGNQDYPIYDSSVDSTKHYGSAILRRCLSGGCFNETDKLMSSNRSLRGGYMSSYVSYVLSTRGCKENRNILGR